ncbi:MAG: hypothetical protein WD873_01670, partial [Candidatus Hydrogenedentales bacterium]
MPTNPDSANDARLVTTELNVKDGRFHLNHRPVHLKMASIDATTAADATTLAHLKSLEFNTVLLDHGRRDLLDAADRSGLMTWLRGTLAELEADAPRLQSHSSLAAWLVILLAESALPERVPEAIDALRCHDGQRLIVVVSETKAGYRCHYSMPTEPVHTLDWLHVPLQSPVSATEEAILRHVGETDVVSVADFGGRPTLLKTAEPVFDDRPADPDALEAARRSLVLRIDAARLNGQLAGYIVP